MTCNCFPHCHSLCQCLCASKIGLATFTELFCLWLFTYKQCCECSKYPRSWLASSSRDCISLSSYSRNNASKVRYFLAVEPHVLLKKTEVCKDVQLFASGQNDVEVEGCGSNEFFPLFFLLFQKSNEFFLVSSFLIAKILEHFLLFYETRNVLTDYGRPFLWLIEQYQNRNDVHKMQWLHLYVICCC